MSQDKEDREAFSVAVLLVVPYIAILGGFVGLVGRALGFW